jgi:hypothetical protein
MILSCLTCSTVHSVSLAEAARRTQLGKSLTDSLARRYGRQCILLYTQMQYCGTVGRYVEKPAETQNNIWLASRLVRVPDS